ncbi:MAG: hypothetical protein ACKPKO_39895 [Candidatus Fonsibacter sp.]
MPNTFVLPEWLQTALGGLQPIAVSVPEVADAMVKVLQHTKQLDLALAGTTDIVNGWAEFEELGQQTGGQNHLANEPTTSRMSVATEQHKLLQQAYL